MVMPRKYMRTAAPSGALRPRPRAMAAQRAAEKILDTTDATTATANHRASTAANCLASAAGSTYQTTATSRATPSAIRPAGFNYRLYACAATGRADVLAAPYKCAES